MTNENFNPEDYVGKTFKSEKGASHKMPFNKEEAWTVKERRNDGGPFSGNNDWLIEQDGEVFEVESKKGRHLLQREETKELEG